MARLGLIRAAHHIVANSEHTASDAVEHLGIPEERITVIHSGASNQHSSLVSSKEEADRILRESLPQIRPGFLLYVGGDDHRKNLDGAMRAYAQLPQSLRDAHQLVIAFRVGPMRKFELRVGAQPLGIRPRDLVFTGYVTDEQLAALYRRCELFVFPSLYEGAGLPVLEAMSCGAPVATSNTTSIPELLGDLEATFDPADPADIARGIREALETPGELDRLRERSRQAGGDLHVGAGRRADPAGLREGPRAAPSSAVPLAAPARTSASGSRSSPRGPPGLDRGRPQPPPGRGAGGARRAGDHRPGQTRTGGPMTARSRGRRCCAP